MCGACGELVDDDKCFEIDDGIELYLEGIERISEKLEDDSESCCAYHICNTCMSDPLYEDLLNKWISDADHSQWIKKMSNPNYKPAEVDKTIAEIFMKSGK